MASHHHASRLAVVLAATLASAGSGRAAVEVKHHRITS